MRATAFLLAEADPPSKREILRCALSLFVRDGLFETSIRAIARATHYTNPALYKFFPSKEALALHLFERCYAHLFEVIDATQAPAQPFAARLGALTEAYADLLDENLEAVLYVNETLRTFWPRMPAPARRRSLLGLLRSLVDAGRREGAIDPGTDAQLAVAVLVGTMGQVARMVYFDEIERPLASRGEGLRALFVNALTGGRLDDPQRGRGGVRRALRDRRVHPVGARPRPKLAKPRAPTRAGGTGVPHHPRGSRARSGPASRR